MVVREDLSPGYQLVQSNHAVVEFTLKYRRIVKKWNKSSNYISSLSVPNEMKLLGLANLLKENGIKCTIFYEPDINNKATALVIQPGEKSSKLCSNLPLALKGVGIGINKHMEV